jgi:hypothetical protein
MSTNFPITRAEAQRDTRHKRMAIFLEAIKNGDETLTAAEAAGVDRRTLYNWRSSNPDFAEAWDTAIQRGLEYYENKIKKHTDEDWRAAAELLRARNPAKWRSTPPPPQQPVNINILITEAEGSVGKFHARIAEYVSRGRTNADASGDERERSLPSDAPMGSVGSPRPNGAKR